MTPEERIAALEAENEKLRLASENRKARHKSTQKFSWNMLKRSSGLMLGIPLKKSIEKFLEEMGEKQNVSRETLSDLLSNIILRLTRIGFFLMLTAVLPSVLLLFQTYYLAKQNTLITNQSELFLEQTNRLDQQTYLQEADRRAAVILSLDNLISEVNDEISNGRPLSQATTGRLVAFSKILKPYRYLENDSLTIRPISPERGYLLTVLLESPVRLNSRLSRSQPTLKERLDFTYAELRGATIVREDLQQIDLSFADLQEAKLTGTDFKNSDFKEVTFKNTDFSFASLEGSNLEGAVLTNANLNGTNLKKAKLYGANLLNVRLNNTVIVDSEFNEALVSEDFFASAKANLDEANFKYLSENFLMEEKEKGVYWLISKKTED